MIISDKSLKPFHEIVGQLMDIQKENNHIRLVFSINKEIDIPAQVFIEKELELLIGKRIGLFNNNGNYKIRKIKRKKNL